MNASNLWAGLFVMGAVVVACGDDTQTVQPQKAQKQNGDDDDVAATSSTSSSSTSSTGGAVVDAATGGAAVTYHATLAKTQSIQFGGGSGHCTYNIVMSDIDIELAITPEGNVIGGSAKNSMTESTLVGTCLPLGLKPMSFAFAAPDGGTLTWAQAATGSPKTNLTLTLTKKGAGYEGAVEWVRADRTDDLQWTVNTTVTLDPK